MLGIALVILERADVLKLSVEPAERCLLII